MIELKKIESILREQKDYLKNQFYVEKIGVFGSYSRGEETPESDIDIYVKFNDPIGWKYFILKEFLEKILNKKVELATKNALRPQMKDNILHEVIYV
jgi:predicted nucleotidyltransferase